MYTVSNIPHLRNLKLAVEYRELLETEEESRVWKSKQKWKQDPDAARYHGFAPRRKYYVNGDLVGEELPKTAQISKTPFPEKRVPRRGLNQVAPDDPDYARLCMEQGLEHLLNGHPSSPLMNGIHSSPISQKSATLVPHIVNGTNGVSARETPNGGLVNGTNGSSV